MNTFHIWFTAGPLNLEYYMDLKATSEENARKDFAERFPRATILEVIKAAEFHVLPSWLYVEV